MSRWSLAVVPMLAAGAFAFARPGAHVTPPVTHHIRMEVRGAKYMFVPADITINQGDVVEFDNISGYPHDIEFDPNHIPAGAKAVLNKNMPQRQGDLQGPFLTQPHQKYSISFAGAPKGEYHYFCLPHRALGMVGVITVK